MDGSDGDRDRSFALAERAHALMRDYGPSAEPRSYAVWYAYAATTRPQLNEAVKQITASSGRLSGQDIDTLYRTYVDPTRLTTVTEQASSGVLSEIAEVMEVIDLSLGSTAQFDASLRTLVRDLDGANPQQASVHKVVAALVATTREVTASNRTLEARMRESRGEIESLRATLEATRLEGLTDPLTGLSNRKHFEDSLCKLVHGASAAEPACLIVIDVDSFKRFNDVYGHITGDQVLRLVAIVMREQVDAPGAVLARFGGEEFAMVLPGIDRATARSIAETVRTSVMSRELVKRSTGESLGKVTISLGLAMHRPGDTAVSLLERADQCMFRAKRDGRNRTADDADEDLSSVA